MFFTAAYDFHRRVKGVSQSMFFTVALKFSRCVFFFYSFLLLKLCGEIISSAYDFTAELKEFRRVGFHRSVEIFAVCFFSTPFYSLNSAVKNFKNSAVKKTQ